MTTTTNENETVNKAPVTNTGEKSKSKEKTKQKEQTSVYAVTGSWQASDFILHQTNSDNLDNIFSKFKEIKKLSIVRSSLAPVQIRTHQGYSGSVSNFAPYSNDEQSSRKFGDQTPESPNPGSRDNASLSPENNILIVTGSIKLINNFKVPSISDNPVFTEAQSLFVSNFLSEDPLPLKLIQAYLNQIKNGALLWRNKHGFSLSVLVSIVTTDSSDVFDFKIDSSFNAAVEKVTRNLKENILTRLDILIAVDLGEGSEVYPSQPFMDSDQKEKIRPSKSKSYGRVLSTVSNTDLTAILHSQKVANAFRSIDSWYSPESSNVTPIAVEAFGVVTSQRQTYRTVKNSFYDYFYPSKLNNYSALTENEKLYIMAMFLKGGLFGNSEKQ